MSDNAYSNTDSIKPIKRILINVIKGNEFKIFAHEKEEVLYLYVNEEDCAKMLGSLHIPYSNTHSNKGNKGKKPTHSKRYGKAVRSLRNEGKTIREIAEILGISTTTVQKILKENDTQ